jgi:pimeloyl-ACP methyl ester carboxylesterase
MPLPSGLLAALWASVCVAAPAPAPQGNPQPEVAQRDATVYGAKLHYLESGTGPTVVLVHGLGDDASIWRATLPALAATHRVIVPDLIGFGRSDKPLLDYRVGTLVDFLDGLLRQLGVEHAALVGNSLGGWVAAAETLARPQTVTRLVLVDAAGYADLPRALGPHTLRALHLATREDLRWLGPLTFADPRWYAEPALDQAYAQRIAAGDGYTVGRIMEALARGDDALDGRLARIVQPTLVVWGAADRLIAPSYGRRFARDIRGAHLAILPHCGHLPQLECPGALNAALRNFLDAR